MSGALLAANQAPITITFNEIPFGIQVPGVYTEIAPNYDQSGLVGYQAAALLMIPVLSTGTLAPLTPTQVFTVTQGSALAGPGGIGDAMIRAFINANPFSPLFAMSLVTPGGATAASWQVQAQYTASLSQNGYAALYVNGKSYAVACTVGVDSGNTTVTNLLNAINADPLCPVIASNATGGYVTLTARDKGTIGNQIDVRYNLNPQDSVPAGLTESVAKTAGTGVHGVAAAFAAIPTFPATDIVCPWNDSASTAALQTELDRRFGAMVEYDACGWGAFSETTFTPLLADTSGLNSRFASYLGAQNMPSPVYLLAATYGAVASYYLLQDPARQLQTLVLPGIVAPQTLDILIETERQSQLVGGQATFVVNRDGTVRIERAISTYQYSAGNVPDASYRDIMTAKILQRIRYDWRNYVRMVYPRNKMTADGSLAAEYDPNIVTPRRMASAWASRCKLYEQLGWIQNSKATAAASIFQLDVNNPNQMDARQQLQIMNNLMVLAGRIEFNVATPQVGALG
nr:phage tail sheath subtilisin-like domain-containing protein [uncultured Rhodopila sp.]